MSPENTKTCNYCGHNFWALDKCPKCRDQFAAAALTGILADTDSSRRNIPLACYQMADSMMEARDK